LAGLDGFLEELACGLAGDTAEVPVCLCVFEKLGNAGLEFERPYDTVVDNQTDTLALELGEAVEGT